MSTRSIKIVVCLILLSGCSSFKPYGYAYIVDPVDGSTDHWVHPNRSWQCDSPWVILGAGGEHKSGVRIGVHHLSTLQCGSWNEKPEVYYNGFVIGGDWGGW